MVIKGNARIFKSKEFWFVVLFYPLCLIAYLITKGMYINTHIFKLESTQRYFDVSTAILAVTVIYTIYERIEKRFTYKLQGDKLKIKQAEKGWKK